MMRMLVGMVLRISEMMTLLKASTAITERPMTIAGSSLTVTASTEQMPRICTMTGLFLEKGLKNTLLFDIRLWLLFVGGKVCQELSVGREAVVNHGADAFAGDSATRHAVDIVGAFGSRHSGFDNGNRGKVAVD